MPLPVEKAPYMGMAALPYEMMLYYNVHFRTDAASPSPHQDTHAEGAALAYIRQIPPQYGSLTTATTPRAYIR